MFNFKDYKKGERATKKGIGFTTYDALKSESGYPNLHTGKLGTRFAQLLENIAGKRPPLEVINPTAHGTLQWLKNAGRGDFPSWDQVQERYHAEPAEDQKRLLKELPKPLADMLNNPKTHTKPKYDAVLKTLKEFDNYDTTHKTATKAEFTEAAEKFEGVIMFDEAHHMRTEGSTTNRIGLTLQRVAPNARVIYLSATPITSVSEIQYAERLGLWGPEMPFKTYQDFARAFAGDDLTAKEIIAKDLKGLGRYLRRSLDMSGVKWETREHQLTADQKVQYDEYVKIMRSIKQNLRNWAERQQHLEPGYGKPRSKLMGNVMKGYYLELQTFFNQLQTAYKAQALLPDIIKDLKDGKKVAVQVSKTGETAQKRAEKRAGEGEPDLSLKNILIDFLMRDTSPIYKQI